MLLFGGETIVTGDFGFRALPSCLSFSSARTLPLGVESTSLHYFKEVKNPTTVWFFGHFKNVIVVM